MRKACKNKPLTKRLVCMTKTNRKNLYVLNGANEIRQMTSVSGPAFCDISLLQD